MCFWVTAISACLVFPFTWCHACVRLEGTEEGGLVGESRLEIQLDGFDVGLLGNQLFGMIDAIGVDEMREGTPL